MPGIANTEEFSMHTLFLQMRKQTEDKIWMSEISIFYESRVFKVFRAAGHEGPE